VPEFVVVALEAVQIDECEAALVRQLDEVSVERIAVE
jgi:hypothetical protein